MSSISSSDMYLGLVPGEFGTQVVLALSILVAIYFTTLKVLFGSYSIIRIFKEYKRKETIKNEYRNLFVTREGLLYHIGRAQVLLLHAITTISLLLLLLLLLLL